MTSGRLLLSVRDLLGSISEARGRLAALGRMSETNFLADYRTFDDFRDQIMSWLSSLSLI